MRLVNFSQFVEVLDSTAQPDITVESLTKVSVNDIRFCSLHPSTRTHTHTQTFQDQGMSDYLVCYIRILTSGYLQSNSEFYGAFVEGGRTVKEYCSQVRGCIVLCQEYYLPVDALL